MASPAFFNLSQARIDDALDAALPFTSYEPIANAAEHPPIRTLDKFYQLYESLPQTLQNLANSRKINLVKEMKSMQYMEYLSKIMAFAVVCSLSPPVDLAVEILTSFNDIFSLNHPRTPTSSPNKDRIVRSIYKIAQTWSDYFTENVFPHLIDGPINDDHYHLLTPQLLAELTKDPTRYGAQASAIPGLLRDFRVNLRSLKLDGNALLLFGCFYPELLMVLPIDLEIPLVVAPIPHFFFSAKTKEDVKTMFSTNVNWQSLDFKRSNLLVLPKAGTSHTISSSPRKKLYGSTSAEKLTPRKSFQDLIGSKIPSWSALGLNTNLPMKSSSSSISTLFPAAPDSRPPHESETIKPSSPVLETSDDQSTDSNPGTGRRQLQARKEKMLSKEMTKSASKAKAPEISVPLEGTLKFELESVQDNISPNQLFALNAEALHFILVINKLGMVPEQCNYHVRLDDEERLSNRIASASVTDTDMIVDLFSSPHSVQYLLTFDVNKRIPIFTLIIDPRHRRYS